MKWWSGAVGRHPWLVLIAGVLLIVVAGIYGLGVIASLSQGGFEDPDSESAKELRLQQDLFPHHEADIVVIYSSTTELAGDPDFSDAVTSTLADLPSDEVDGIITWYSTRAPDLLSEDKHATRAIITLAGSTPDEKADAADVVIPLLDASGLRTDILGEWAVFHDVTALVTADIVRAEALAIPIVMVLSLVIFGSVAAALMPTLIGMIAVLGAFAVVRIMTQFTDVSVFAINIITLLGMGLAIDYALFIVSRFREELAFQPDTSRVSVRAALATTMATAGRTVLFSGLIVAASLASLILFPQTFLTSMGFGGVAAVLVAVVAALTILPAILAILGKRIEFGRMPWRRPLRTGQRRPENLAKGHAAQFRRDRERPEGGWAKVAHSVMRRPVLYLVAITAGLLILAAPFTSAQWGGVDDRVLPEDSPARVAAQFQEDTFGVQPTPVTIVLQGADAAAADAYARKLSPATGSLPVYTVDTTTSGGRSSALVRVDAAGDAQTPASQDLVRAIRAVDPGDGVTAFVGGQAAITVDLIDSIGSHLPWMGLIVAAVMFVLLFIAFGSLVLPVKAILMNIVSISASFGIVTWIFQDGNLSGLLGFTSPGYLDATQPILMLAILFGLSMDYEVFLLSRVREEWDLHGDNTRAVATGLQHTGRIITSAAVLLAVVIGGFSTSSILFIKMIGVGMLVAVLLDATVVRALLVPATMRLLGPTNWWAPAPLHRWWVRFGHHSGTLAADADAATAPRRAARPSGPAGRAGPRRSQPEASTQLAERMIVGIVDSVPDVLRGRRATVTRFTVLEDPGARADQQQFVTSPPSRHLVEATADLGAHAAQILQYGTGVIVVGHEREASALAGDATTPAARIIEATHIGLDVSNAAAPVAAERR